MVDMVGCDFELIELSKRLVGLEDCLKLLFQKPEGLADLVLLGEFSFLQW